MQRTVRSNGRFRRRCGRSVQTAFSGGGAVIAAARDRTVNDSGPPCAVGRRRPVNRGTWPIAQIQCGLPKTASWSARPDSTQLEAGDHASLRLPLAPGAGGRIDRTAGDRPTCPCHYGMLKSKPSILASAKAPKPRLRSNSVKMAATLPLASSTARLSAPFFPWS